MRLGLGARVVLGERHGLVAARGGRWNIPCTAD